MFCWMQNHWFTISLYQHEEKDEPGSCFRPIRPLLEMFSSSNELYQFEGFDLVGVSKIPSWEKGSQELFWAHLRKLVKNTRGFGHIWISQWYWIVDSGILLTEKNQPNLIPPQHFVSFFISVEPFKNPTNPPPPSLPRWLVWKNFGRPLERRHGLDQLVDQLWGVAWPGLVPWDLGWQLGTWLAGWVDKFKGPTNLWWFCSL